MSPTEEPRIQARIDDDTMHWLNDRARRMAGVSANQQARIELTLWRSTLRTELRRIRLTLGQANCFADVLSAATMDAAVAIGVGLVAAELEDAFQVARTAPIPDASSYGDKWSIDEPALLDYLRSLSPTADHALRDAVSRWWDQRLDSTVEGWATVGLTVTP